MTAIPSADPSLDARFAARDIRIDSQLEKRAFRLTFVDFAGFAAVTGTVPFFTISNTLDAQIHDVTIDLQALAVGPSVTAMVLDVGKTNGPDVDAYLDGVLGFAGLGRKGNTAAEKGVDLDVAEDANVLPAGESISLTPIATGANLEVLTALDVVIIVTFSLYPTAPAAA